MSTTDKPQRKLLIHPGCNTLTSQFSLIMCFNSVPNEFGQRRQQIPHQELWSIRFVPPPPLPHYSCGMGSKELMLVHWCHLETHAVHNQRGTPNIGWVHSVNKIGDVNKRKKKEAAAEKIKHRRRKRRGRRKRRRWSRRKRRWSSSSFENNNSQFKNWENTIWFEQALEKQFNLEECRTRKKNRL